MRTSRTSGVYPQHDGEQNLLSVEGTSNFSTMEDEIVPRLYI